MYMNIIYIYIDTHTHTSKLYLYAEVFWPAMFGYWRTQSFLKQLRSFSPNFSRAWHRGTGKLEEQQPQMVPEFVAHGLILVII